MNYLSQYCARAVKSYKDLFWHSKNKINQDILKISPLVINFGRNLIIYNNQFKIFQRLLEKKSKNPITAPAGNPMTAASSTDAKHNWMSSTSSFIILNCVYRPVEVTTDNPLMQAKFPLQKLFAQEVLFNAYTHCT